MAAKEFADGILSFRLFILIALLGLAAVGAIYSTATYVRGNARGRHGRHGPLRAALQQPAVGLADPLVRRPRGPARPLARDRLRLRRDQRRAGRADAAAPASPSPSTATTSSTASSSPAWPSIGLVLLARHVPSSGVAFFVLGIQPSPEDLPRLFSGSSWPSLYLGFWLAFAMLCSVILRRAATSALIAIGLWIVLTLFTALLVGIFAGYLAPVSQQRHDRPADRQRADAARPARGSRPARSTASRRPTCWTRRSRPWASSRSTSRATPGASHRPCPCDQSLLLTLPQVVALLAETVLCFGPAYVVFMRQEVRA